MGVGFSLSSPEQTWGSLGAVTREKDSSFMVRMSVVVTCGQHPGLQSTGLRLLLTSTRDQASDGSTSSPRECWPLLAPQTT